MKEEVVTISRLALEGKDADLRLYLAKVVRKLKKTDSELSSQLEELLKFQPSRAQSVMRKDNTVSPRPAVELAESSNELSLLKRIQSSDLLDEEIEPLLQSQVRQSLDQVLRERGEPELLFKHGLPPTSSIIFQGPPGVGKTMTAQWLAFQLDLPMYILDLTAVMSSYLGKTGSNLRAVIEFAKSHPCILLLDEIDAIAKKRNDEADVGELKRLVTVMLQELDSWPTQGLLIAATNHPELVDPALWRRFDMEITFALPSDEQVGSAVHRFLGEDLDRFEKWQDFLVDSLKGRSYSHIKRVVYQLRRLMIFSPNSFEAEAVSYLHPEIENMSRAEKINYALNLVKKFNFTQQKAAAIAHVSRDTIRKKLLQI